MKRKSVSDFSGQNTQQVIELLNFMCYKGHFSCQGELKKIDHKHVDDNEDTIEDEVREMNVTTFVEVTYIVKIVRKEINFWIL